MPAYRSGRNLPAILMEMKRISGFYEEEPDKAIAGAGAQIGTRACARELKAREYTDILKIEVVSDGTKGQDADVENEW